MAEDKKKNSITFIIFAVLFAVFFVVCYGSYFDFAEGSLIKAIVDGLAMLSVDTIGFVIGRSLDSLVLIPLICLFMLLAFDSAVKARYYTYISHFFVFLCSYVILGVLDPTNQGWIAQNVPFYVLWIAIGVVVICLALNVLFVFFAIKALATDLNQGKEKRRKAKKEQNTVQPDPQEEKTLKIKNRASEMSYTQALASLTAVQVPEYQCYQNFYQDDPAVKQTSVQSSIFDIAFEAANIQRENQKKREEKEAQSKEKLDRLFRPTNIERIVSQASMENDDFDFSFDFQPTYDEPDSKPSEENVQSVRENHIIDEGTEPEDMEPELEKRKSSKRNIDLLSAVGGLKSSKDGSYLYDSSKFQYQFPSENLLKHYNSSVQSYPDKDSDPDGRIIVETLAQFRIPTELVGIQHGPTFTLYELSLGKGIRVNSVQTLADNLAMDLAVQSVRILAPIPGKSAIGIEVPNKKRDTIGFDVMMPALKSKELKVPMVLGRTITGDSVVIDLAGAPHLLIAGTTGSGKSVCVNSLICSILYTKTPKQVRMILVDPKMVELTVYNDIPHLLTPVITEPKKAIKAMAFIVEEMERRMSMFSQLGARKIEDYNEKILQKGFLRAQLPYIVVVIDEFADLMTVVGKELEAYIKRITAVARFTGIHLVLATQRPSADVITGIIKSNMPTQIAFAVSNQVNSRIILDSIGAEKLLGRGDMLYASASNRSPQRIQGAYIDSEIEQIVSFVKTQGQPDYIDESYFEDDDEESSDSSEEDESSGSEDMFTKAWKIVADKGEASASYLQRRLSIGYNRAANLIEQLEDAGYIGPARGSKPREVLRYPDSNS